MESNTLTPAEQFFYDNAGFSYTLNVETPNEGRIRCARSLADAEQWALDMGAGFEWMPDDAGTIHTLDFPDAYDSEPETCEVAIMRIDGEMVAVLGCIDDASDDYRRVIEAELASEARWETQKALQAVTGDRVLS